MFEQLVSEAASRFNISPASVSSLMRGLLALFADGRDSANYLDAALMLALLAFAGTLAAARYHAIGRVF